MLSISYQLLSVDLPEDLKSLLSKPSENEKQIIDYLTTKDEGESSFIFNAVINGEYSKVKAILSSLKGYPEILQKVLMQKKNLAIRFLCEQYSHKIKKLLMIFYHLCKIIKQFFAQF